jgi:hypothetical protein
MKVEKIEESTQIIASNAGENARLETIYKDIGNRVVVGHYVRIQSHKVYNWEFFYPRSISK